MNLTLFSWKQDNIHAQSISLYDFAVLHQSCGVPGYLHLDLKLQVRFKSRWDEIKRAVSEQEKEYEAEGMRSYNTKKKDCSFVSVGYPEQEQAAPNEEGQETFTGQARSTTVNDEQAQDGTNKGPRQPELTDPAPASTSPHQSQQQQQPTDNSSSFDLSEFVGFEEPPLDDDDDNWDDDDTVRLAHTTADTFTSLAHIEVPAQNSEDQGEGGGQEEQEEQEDYTNPHQFPEGDGVSAEYGEYEEGEWVAEEGHEQEEGAPVEQTEVPAAGQAEGQGQLGMIEAGAFSLHALEREKIEWLAGDEVAQYDGEEYIGPEYEYIYNEGEDVEGEVRDWTGGSFTFFFPVVHFPTDNLCPGRCRTRTERSDWTRINGRRGLFTARFDSTRPCTRGDDSGECGHHHYNFTSPSARTTTSPATGA